MDFFSLMHNRFSLCECFMKKKMAPGAQRGAHHFLFSKQAGGMNIEVSLAPPCSPRKTTLTAGHENRCCDHINKQLKMCSITQTTLLFLHAQMYAVEHVHTRKHTLYTCLCISVEGLVRWFPWKWEYEIKMGWGFQRMRQPHDSWKTEKGTWKWANPSTTCL